MSLHPQNPPIVPDETRRLARAAFPKNTLCLRIAGALAASHARCTRGKREPRIIGLQAREHFEASQGARSYQKPEAFRKSYALRAGIEGTHAQALSRYGLRRCHYIGLAKTRLQHVLTAVGINLVRVAEWFADTRVAQTRRFRFARLQIAT